MRGLVFALVVATLTVASTAKVVAPRKCAPGGNVCRLLAPEVLGCCKPKVGTPFSTGQCDCRTCHLGTWTPGQCTPRPCICPLIFQPVCCLVKGKRETKGNACGCRCAGGTVVSEGKCEEPGACICPKIFQPTCCKRKKDGKLFTASNKCTCECEGTIVSPGACPVTTKPPSCICPAVFKPVCCEVDGKQVTKGNSCECDCAKGDVLSEGQCQKPCVCPEIFQPTCCKRKKDESLFTADNPCTCKCEGSVVSPGRCPVTTKPPVCPCPKILEPTCCKRKSDGRLFSASNRCTCECVGTIIGPGKCPDTSCATVKCANCEDTIDGPKCSPPATTKPPTLTIRPFPTCASTLCSTTKPCCIETNRGAQCVRLQDRRCPRRRSCRTVKCGRPRTCCIETYRGPKCVLPRHWRCRRKY